MGRLRALSGSQVLAILRSFGFTVHDQRGSHVKLRRLSPEGARQTLAVPRHDDLDKGTLQAIFRQASRFIPASDQQPATLPGERLMGMQSRRDGDRRVRGGLDNHLTGGRDLLQSGKEAAEVVRRWHAVRTRHAPACGWDFNPENRFQPSRAGPGHPA
jgi:predicted RNA binding protein YcfA (HicA-like mRNA interferase family)